MLIHSHQDKRVNWKKGEVFEVIKGRDGVVRSAWVELRSGGRLQRPARCLHVLGGGAPVCRSTTATWRQLPQEEYSHLMW